MPVVEREWEWHFAASPEALWPLVADTALVGEANGFPRYTVTDTPRADGSVEHIASARRFGMRLVWEDAVPEWIAGRRYSHERRFRSRLVRRLATRILLDAQPGGTRVRYRLTFDTAWPVALALYAGGLTRTGKTLHRLFGDAVQFAEAATLPSARQAPVAQEVRRRVEARAAALAAQGHGAAHKLAHHLLEAPETELE